MTHPTATVVEPELAGRPRIEISGLDKTFDTKSGSVHALSDVNLSIQDGEFVSIVGPSGCGKTTLLRILAGLETATTGVVSVASSRRNNVGMVFQRSVLLPWRTVIDNVLLPIELDHKPSPGERTAALELLSLVGLQDFVKKYPNELSGGMQQRVAICRALIHDPEVLLMDEPFGALDAMTRDTLNLETHRIWRETGKTALLITHSIPEAVFLSQRVVVMGPRPGRVLDIIDVPFGTERSLDLLSSPEFARLTGRVRAYFDNEE